jgi:capsid protein
MSRLSHWAGVRDLRWNTIIPMFCEPIWGWWAELQGIRRAVPTTVDWTAPPMPMLEPDREGKAYRTLVRAGAMTPDEMVRERGLDPETHWAEYEANMSELDRRGIWLDIDVRKTSDAGLAQPDGVAPGKGDDSVLGGNE